MKKRYFLISLIALILLAGCHSQKVIESRPNDFMNQEEIIPKSAENRSDTLERYLAYASTLENFYLDKISTYGIQSGEPVSGPDFSQNKFAIYDVDGDGKDELMIVYTTDAMAGQAEYIYGYHADTNEVFEKFVNSPFCTIYDNGVIVADLSHNQGTAGMNFWPFWLHQYNTDSQKYEQVALVDAWDKSYMEVNFDGTPFPDELDIDHDGFLYYVQKNGQETEIMNLSEYKEWLDSYLENAKELEIPFVDYTEANYKSIEK